LELRQELIMGKNDYIEIICPECDEKNFLHFNDTFQDRELKCSHCSAAIYWHHCDKCETGFYDARKDFTCPHCNPQMKEITSDKIKKPFLSKECPWCGGHINYFKIVIVKNNIHICPHCSRYFEETAILRSVFFVLLYFMFFAVIARNETVTYLKETIPPVLFIIMLIFVMFFGAVLVFYFFRDMKRLK